MRCVGCTLTEDGRAAVIAPKGDRSPGKMSRPAPVLLPRARILLVHSRLQQILEVLH